MGGAGPRGCHTSAQPAAGHLFRGVGVHRRRRRRREAAAPVSHDTGSTWRESGRGLPPGRAVAVAPDDPDLLVYAARNRLYLSRNGGVFWSALAVELPEIERVAFEDATLRS